MQLLYAANPDDIRARALHTATHGVQKVRQIDDMRLLRGVVNGGRSLRTGCGKHDVDGSADGDHIHEYIRADKPIRFRNDQTARRFNPCAERTHALDMLVNRAASDIASAGKRNLRASEAGKQRTDIIRGRAHAAAKLKRNIRPVDGAGIDLHHAGIRIPIDLRTQMTQGFN